MSGYFFEDLSVGLSASLGKTITEADILMFAAVSMDTNPVPLNAEIAAESVVTQRIAHGMLSAGLISAVLGTQLPGPGTIYMGQTLRFRAPVKIGDYPPGGSRFFLSKRLDGAAALAEKAAE